LGISVGFCLPGPEQRVSTDNEDDFIIFLTPFVIITFRDVSREAACGKLHPHVINISVNLVHIFTSFFFCLNSAKWKCRKNK